MPHTSAHTAKRLFDNPLFFLYDLHADNVSCFWKLCKNLTEKGVGDFVPPRFFGGMTKSITLNPGKRSTFDIPYSGAGLNGKPSAIILTPIAKDGEETMGVPSVISGTVGPESARGQILGGGLKKSIVIYFLVIQNQS